jgi:hypothetical protein
MLCCLGLVAGLAVGSALGGPWALIAPVAGLSLGLIGDLTLIKHGLHNIHKNAEQWIQTRQSELRHEESKEV